jgi:hypothetical protein
VAVAVGLALLPWIIVLVLHAGALFNKLFWPGIDRTSPEHVAEAVRSMMDANKNLVDVYREDIWYTKRKLEDARAKLAEIKKSNA